MRTLWATVAVAGAALAAWAATRTNEQAYLATVGALMLTAGIYKLATARHDRRRRRPGYIYDQERER